MTDKIPPASAAPTLALPVDEARERIVHLVRRHPAIVIVGETGSGKTTRVPQFVLDDFVACRTGAGDGHMIAVTQPRRVAAVSIAQYVAKCRGCQVGGEVGYAVRFDDNSSAATRLKFMTDGILLREILNDPTLSKYSVVILDEAHERTLHGDVLFGLLKALTRSRSDLRVIVMSATLNAEHFSQFWRNAPIGVVKGRTFPVTVLHTAEPQADYVDAAINAIMQIHMEEPEGDILCFLTGQEEIEDTRMVLEERRKCVPESHALKIRLFTLYSAMPYEQQLKVFEAPTPGERRVILATNIAETSITIEGIMYVIDCGLVKAKSFDPKTSLDTLKEIPESKAQARQRTGRAGRMAAGKCYRLYPEAVFEDLPEDTIPEILRCSLTSIVLQMKAMGIEDVEGFEFMDQPDPQAIRQATHQLLILGALNRDGGITRLGRRMIDFPIEPMAAKSLIASQQLGVASEVAAVIAMLTTDNVFFTSRFERDAADRMHASFSKPAGDHITLLNIFLSFTRHSKKSQRAWCEQHYFNYRQMTKAVDTYTQLMGILTTGPAVGLHDDAVEAGRVDGSARLGKRGRKENGSVRVDADQSVASSGGISQRESIALADGTQDEFSSVRRAFCHGYFPNAAFFNPREQTYQSIVSQQRLAVHPTSVVQGSRRKPPLVVFNNVVQTSKKYMKYVFVAREEWLLEASPNYFGRRQ